MHTLKLNGVHYAIYSDKEILERMGDLQKSVITNAPTSKVNFGEDSEYGEMSG